MNTISRLGAPAAWAPPRTLPAASPDAFSPGLEPLGLPTRADVLAAARPQATAMRARGGANGLPLEWDIRPVGDGSTRLWGQQNGLGVDAVVREAGGAIEIEGHQNGRGLYVRLERSADGSLSVEGRRTGRGLSYRLAWLADGRLHASGAQDGMSAGFTVASAQGALAPMQKGQGRVGQVLRQVEQPPEGQGPSSRERDLSPRHSFPSG
ncbi:MAG TPA: hypothetical protein VNO81_10675 [Candidatus Nitrosotenuis sp.]|nr:hypothetical protein [Candidatus Nitrosotenuis sp.]